MVLELRSRGFLQVPLAGGPFSGKICQQSLAQTLFDFCILFCPGAKHAGRSFGSDRLTGARRISLHRETAHFRRIEFAPSRQGVNHRDRKSRQSSSKSRIEIGQLVDKVKCAQIVSKAASSQAVFCGDPGNFRH